MIQDIATVSLLTTICREPAGSTFDAWIFPAHAIAASVQANSPRRIPVPDFSIPVPDFSIPVPDFSIPVPDFSIPVPDFSIPVPLLSIVQRDIVLLLSLQVQAACRDFMPVTFGQAAKQNLRKVE
jgi:hypothetical protein